MKIIIHFLFLLMFLFPLNSFSQILVIDERDESSTSFEPAQKVIDLNSDIRVTIDRKELKKKLLESNIIYDDKKLDERIKTIGVLLEARNSSLLALQKATDLWKQKGVQVDQKELARLLKEAADPTLKVLNGSPAIREIFFSSDVPNDPARQYAIAFDAADQYLNQLLDSLDLQAKEQGVFIQLGAWIFTDGKFIPLHLDGFDDNPNLPAFKVNRFILFPDTAELRKVSALVEQVRKNGALAVAKENEAYKKMVLEVTAALNSLKLKVTDYHDAIGAQYNAVSDSVNAASRAVTEYYNFLTGLVTKYSSQGNAATSGDLLLATITDMQAVAERSGKLKTELTRILNYIRTTPVQNIAVLKALIDDTERFMTQGIATTAESFKRLTAIVSGKPFDHTAATFTDNTYKLALGALPSSTTVSLLNAGRREKGDRLLIEICAGKTGVSSTELENRSFPMYMVLPHIETKVGIVFNDPLQPNQLQRQFQIAPSYSVLLKGLCPDSRRKHMIRNTVWDWGIGINISSPDFDKDDVPELGLGFVVSGLRDYLQAGVGYNVFVSKSYWFFGLRLPLQFLQLPLSSPDQQSISR